MTPFKPAAFDAICQRIMSGESLKHICDSKGTPARSVVYEWLASDKAIADRYARACEIRADRIFDEMLDIADNGENDWMEQRSDDGKSAGWRENGEAIRRSVLRIDARKWALARMQPKKYGDKVAVDNTSSDGSMRPIFNTYYEPKKD